MFCLLPKAVRFGEKERFVLSDLKWSKLRKMSGGSEEN